MLHCQISKNRKCTTHHWSPSKFRNLFIYTTSIIILILITITIYDSSPMDTSTYVGLPDSPPQIYREEYLKHKREAGLPIEAQEIPVVELRTPIRGEDNIIFLYTTCVALNKSSIDDVTTELRLTYQQVCAIESAALMNPMSKVYLFYTCPLDSDSLSKSSVLIRRLFEIPNINIWHQTLSNFFQDTPLDAFYKSGKMQRSKYRISHTSDVLRYLALWKYGGIYLDLDFIITKSLDGLGKNFAGAESEDVIASGAMGLSVNGIGKEVADACVEELRTNFRGDIWPQNGPMVITTTMQTKCDEEKTTFMTRDKCGGFQVHNVSVFYALNAYDWEYLFTEKNSEITMTTVRNSHAVHFWNSMEEIENGKKEVRMREIKSRRMFSGSKQPVALLRQQYCPLVYDHIVAAETMIRL